MNGLKVFWLVKKRRTWMKERMHFWLILMDACFYGFLDVRCIHMFTSWVDKRIGSQFTKKLEDVCFLSLSVAASKRSERFGPKHEVTKTSSISCIRFWNCLSLVRLQTVGQSLQRQNTPRLSKTIWSRIRFANWWLPPLFHVFLDFHQGGNIIFSGRIPWTYYPEGSRYVVRKEFPLQSHDLGTGCFDHQSCSREGSGFLRVSSP